MPAPITHTQLQHLQPPSRKHTMTNPHPLRLLALAALLSAGVGPALAQDRGHPYVGLSVGQARAHLDEEAIASGLVGSGFAVTSITSDRRDTAYRLFGGYQFNPWLAMELGYFDLGKFGFNALTSPAGSLADELRVRGIGLDLVGTLPLTERLSALARVGSQFSRTTSTMAGSGGVLIGEQSTKQRGTNVKLGAGLQYAFDPSFVVRAEGERYRVNDPSGGHGNVNVVSLSLVFPFGRAAEPARRAQAMPSYTVPAPAPVAPVAQAAPEPMPVLEAAAPPPPAPVVQRRRVSYSAESLFAFDQSEIRLEGKAALDHFARELAGAQYDQVSVEGHTDRLGSQAYNQKLSDQRAEAVKAYLVSAGRIDPSKISAIGKSESSPVTKPEDCRGQQASARLILCLQPDRRVDIEVVGSR